MVFWSWASLSQLNGNDVTPCQQISSHKQLTISLIAEQT